MSLLSLTISSMMISVFLLTTAAQEQCDEGFVFSSKDDHCYHASRKAATWVAANQACNQLSSQLVVIPDYSTQQAIDPSTSNQNQCAVMISGKTGQTTWDYFGCTNKYLYICQAAAATTTTTSTTRTTPTTTRTTPTTTRTTTRITTTGPNSCPSAGRPVYGPTSGLVSSPNYPNQYFNNANCVYTIVLQFSAATLRINAFNTEACCDFLYIYDGPTTSYPLIKKLSGTGLTGNVYKATSNSMTLWFTTDSSGTASGWQASYYSS